ncbi:MAG TPA: tetratricopeptide repeat protein [Fimbriimonadaceae bacterium]|nr:tetratricopeptide repeat protein [Fimbriimonadaceae bacterium]
MNSRKHREQERPGGNLASLVLAKHILERGDSAQAIEVVSPILLNDPQHVPALEIKARAQWRLGLYDEALRSLGALTRLNPQEPGYQYLKGLCLQGLGRFGLALRAFERCARSTSPEAQAATEAIVHLREWQEFLIQELIACDREFRRAYLRDAETAAKNRGFDLGKPQTYHAEESEKRAAHQWLRPS